MPFLLEISLLNGLLSLNHTFSEQSILLARSYQQQNVSSVQMEDTTFILLVETDLGFSRYIGNKAVGIQNACDKKPVGSW